MRLSAWRSAAPRREALGPKVRAVLEPVLVTLGAEADPHVWIGWGEDAAYRFTLLVPTAGGLGLCVVRPTGGAEGPRVSAKLVRWSRAQVGDLDVDTQQGHRLATVQVEGTVLRGVDAEADALGRFVQALASAVDGRGLPSLDEPGRRRAPARRPRQIAGS
ncbi:MAG TPA: hypothetical protein VFS32_09710 [Candidatus Limnocylindrales bacterium]|nr:hypothetical protein [Candidatus Limnocylindrales bacterium]